MKSSFLRASIALACALSLSACGGSSGQLLLGGTAYNVTKTGLVLQNNGGDDLAIPANGTVSFYFDKLIQVDEAYNVTVKSVPSNVQSCTITNGTGRSAYNVTNVYVMCTLKTHALKGTVTGNTAGDLVLVNGSDKVTVPANTSTFSMAPVGEDSPYGVTILTQPSNGQTCTVANGTGTMGTTDVTNIAVTCAP
jgi:hypothetical protein